jgi:class 3 adenylate cyclase
MKCPKCQHETPYGARFCNGCGQELDDGTENEKRDPEIEGERKHVTVLFSDLSGYTAMSEKLDPGEVKEITGSIFQEVAQIVSHYDGFVEKYTELFKRKGEGAGVTAGENYWLFRVFP